MPGKAPNGSGSVYQRRDGRWVAAVSLHGRRIVRYAPTRKAAQERLRGLLAQAGAGRLPEPSQLTVAAFLARWLEAGASDLRPKTLRAYGQYVQGYLAPALGDVRLQRLEPLHIVAALARWRQQASPATVHGAYRALHRALAVATQWGLLAANPADRVPKPKLAYKPAKVWTAEEARAFLQATEGDRLYALWAFLLGTGCRLGEALGLEWPDCDLERGTATIRRALVWVGSQPVLQGTKTRASVRTVTLPACVVTALRGWRARQAAERLRAGASWQDQRGAVFTTNRGTAPTGSNLRRAFRAACRRAGVPEVRLHDLRHLAATLLVASGCDAKTVQARLGHSTIQMTLGLYAHAVPEADRLAAEALERALAGR